MRLGMLVFMTLALACDASACLWEYGTNLQGDRIPAELPAFEEGGTGTVARLFPHNATVWSEEVLKRESLYEAHPDSIPEASDYAVALAHLGEYEKALKMFQEIETRSPNSYINAANLGTLYELNGDLPNALLWIRRAMSLNPASHEGTEWLHVKILEAELELQKDPNWLVSHSVSGFEFGEGLYPKLKNGDPEMLRKAAEYQLRERLQFVKAPNAVVGELMFELANAIAVSKSLEDALGVLRLAEDYGIPQSSLERKRKALFRAIIGWGWAKERWTEGILCLAVLATILFFLRRRRSPKNNSQ